MYLIAESDEGEDRAAGRVAVQGGDGVAAAASRGGITASAATTSAAAAGRGALHAQEAQQQAWTNNIFLAQSECKTLMKV